LVLAEFFGNAEIAQNGLSIGSEQDVRGLYIAMDQASLMRCMQCSTDIDADPECVGNREGSLALDALLQ
jgi:hypothetical protein